MKSKYSRFIKLFVSIVIVSSALLIQGCSKSEIENLNAPSLQSTVPQNSVFRVYDKTYNTPKGSQIWEAQLNKIIEMDSNMVRNGLKLIRYEHVRQIATITDLESVKTELKNNNSSFIVYKNNSSRFSIPENKEITTGYRNFIDSLLPTSANILQAIRSKGDASPLAKAAYAFKKNDLGVVNIVWEYNGKTLNTPCLVSTEKGIVYDKFLFSIRTTANKITSVQSKSFKAPQDTPIMQDGEYIQKVFRVDYPEYNSFGTQISDCGVMACLYGHWRNCISYSLPVAENYYTNSWAWTLDEVIRDPYFNTCWMKSCAAFIRMKSFSPTSSDGEIGHLQFDYGIIRGGNVGIVFTGGEYPLITGDHIDLLDCNVGTIVASEMNTSSY